MEGRSTSQPIFQEAEDWDPEAPVEQAGEMAKWKIQANVDGVCDFTLPKSNVTPEKLPSQ